MIPSVDDLRSDPLTHRFGDVFNPPGLTNFLGVVQADTDITGLRSLNFPPLACSDTVTASLFVDGEYFVAAGEPVTYTWQPDRITRHARYRDLELRTILVLAPGERAALLRLEVRPTAGGSRDVDIALLLRGGVTQSSAGWGFLPPTEADNHIERDEGTGAAVFAARHSDAVLVQGYVDAAARFDGRMLHTTVGVSPGQETRVDFVAAVAATRTAALDLFNRHRQRFDATLRAAREAWNAEVAAALTPHNDRYSGWLPELHTGDPAIRRLYDAATAGLIYFRRDNPASVHGRAWDTLMPRFWGTVTFLWDYHLSSTAHALLDPVVMRGYLERWMNVDIHQVFGTEYLRGDGVGMWYAVNDYAMVSMANDYVSWTGDGAWLSSPAPGESRRVVDVLEAYALQWLAFKTHNGLADYGEIGNLLECVSTYIHEVASLNAANVWAMRTVAGMLDGEAERARRLRDEANSLVRRVLDLYASSRGYWRARYPSGALVDVRHCYDFQTVLTTIATDLDAEQRREMAAFFFDELATPRWMRALSARDSDAAFSVRADHQWTGAYPAWPPMAARALFNAGEGARALSWIRGVARSANQGPFGQAHFVEQAVAPDADGARKAPPDMPYITDWACSSCGSWLSFVIESLFGVRATLRDGISAVPQFFDFDPDSRLTGLRYQGKTYTVDARGVRPED